MDRRRMKFLLLGLGIAAIMIVMLSVAVQTSGGLYYYRTVSEFMSSPSSQGDNLRINGTVLAGSIRREPSRVRFVMTEGDHSLPVEYEGIVPDTFVDDADVVVQGELGSDGTFRADLLLAKCPSKYEAADGYGEAGAVAAD